MKTLVILTALLSLSVSGAEFKRTASKYNSVTGTLPVVDLMNPGEISEYVVPLSDEVDLALKRFIKHECIIVNGSKEGGMIFARSVKNCTNYQERQ